MGTIRLVWGTARAATRTAAYDAALVDAGIGDYNLLTVSSVIPAGPPVEAVGTAPDLGPAGEALTVVQARGTAAPGEDPPAVAGLGWARDGDGHGVFYEEGGRDPAAVERTVERGLAEAVRLRGWEPTDREVLLREADPDPDRHACAVVCAVYGGSRPLV